MENKLVAVYGTLKKGFGNHRLLTSSEQVGETITLEGWDMYSLGYFPGIIKGEGTIECEVYSVDADTLQSLDYLEGYREQAPESSLYLRETVDTPYGEAYIYVFNRDLSDSSKTPMKTGVWEHSSSPASVGAY